MNKELIKKYRKEFEWWLNGGKLLARRWYIDPQDGDSSFTTWYEVDLCDTWKMINLLTNPFDKIEFVINDEYSDFRKALAEGKEVQYLSETNIWQPHTEKDSFTYSLERYRIKPDEPKFKVGDWVQSTKYPECIFKVNQIEKTSLSGKYGESTRGCMIEDAVLWKPQPGEWCWFWNDYSEDDINEFNLALLLCQFEQKANSYYLVKEFDRMGFTHCAPFIGELPEHLKDN